MTASPEDLAQVCARLSDTAKGLLLLDAIGDCCREHQIDRATVLVALCSMISESAAVSDQPEGVAAAAQWLIEAGMARLRLLDAEPGGNA